MSSRPPTRTRFSSPRDVGDRGDADIAAIAGIGEAAPAPELRAELPLGLVDRGPAAAADRLAVADRIAVADQPIDDVADHALGVGVGLDLGRSRSGGAAGERGRGEHMRENSMLFPLPNATHTRLRAGGA